MKKIKRGEKYYMEVEADFDHDPDSVWIFHPDHPANEYSGICVYKKHLIPKMEVEKRKRRTQKGAGMTAREFINMLETYMPNLDVPLVCKMAGTDENIVIWASGGDKQVTFTVERKAKP